MIERYCDGCGARIYGPTYIRTKVDIGRAKKVDVHAYAHDVDLCRTCLVIGVEKARVVMDKVDR